MPVFSTMSRTSSDSYDAVTVRRVLPSSSVRMVVTTEGSPSAYGSKISV